MPAQAGEQVNKLLTVFNFVFEIENDAKHALPYQTWTWELNLEVLFQWWTNNEKKGGITVNFDLSVEIMLPLKSFRT